MSWLIKSRWWLISTVPTDKRHQPMNGEGYIRCKLIHRAEEGLELVSFPLIIVPKFPMPLLSVRDCFRTWSRATFSRFGPPTPRTTWCSSSPPTAPMRIGSRIGPLSPVQGRLSTKRRSSPLARMCSFGGWTGPRWVCLVVCVRMLTQSVPGLLVEAHKHLLPCLLDHCSFRLFSIFGCIPLQLQIQNYSGCAGQY